MAGVNYGGGASCASVAPPMPCSPIQGQVSGLRDSLENLNVLISRLEDRCDFVSGPSELRGSIDKDPRTPATGRGLDSQLSELSGMTNMMYGRLENLLARLLI